VVINFVQQSPPLKRPHFPNAAFYLREIIMKKIFLLFAVLILAVYAAAQVREITMPTQTIFSVRKITDKNIADEIKFDGIIILFPADKSLLYVERDPQFKYIEATNKYACSPAVKKLNLNYKENPYAWSFFKDQFTYSRTPYVLILKTDTNTTTDNVAEKIIKNFSGETNSWTIEQNIKETFETYCK